MRAERRPLVVQLTLQVHQPQLQRRIRLLQLLHTKACAVSPFPSELAQKVKEVGSEGGGRTASDWETRWASEFIVVFSVDEAAPRSADLRADTSVRGGERGCAT